MKKIACIFVAMLICVTCLSVLSFASGETIPEDGTVTPTGIYGFIEDIGLNPGPSPRYAVFSTDITLAPGKSFTSYQYEVASGNSYVEAQIGPCSSKLQLSLYGSNSVGGTKTLLGSVTSSTSSSKFITRSNDYRYYNIVVKNIGSTTSTTHVFISTD